MAIDERQRTEITEGLARPKLVPDAIFPDHEFTAHDRKRYRLSEIQGSDPMILILSRGSFCPKDARQHKIMYNGYWFWGRPSPWELWQDLREVTRRIRPDWDLSDPAVRASWDGDKSRHWPYVRR